MPGTGDTAPPGALGRQTFARRLDRCVEIVSARMGKYARGCQPRAHLEGEREALKRVAAALRENEDPVSWFSAEDEPPEVGS
jgi:hypothetical protein